MEGGSAGLFQSTTDSQESTVELAITGLDDPGNSKNSSAAVTTRTTEGLGVSTLQIFVCLLLYSFVQGNCCPS